VPRHKEYMARLESEGRLFCAGLLKNDKEKETMDAELTLEEPMVEFQSRRTNKRSSKSL
jgi:uncharacterized protein YciI